HRRVTVNHRLDFFRVYLESTDIDNAAAPAHEIAATVARLDDVAGVDEAVGTAQRRVRGTEIAAGGARRAYAHRTAFDLDLDLAVLSDEPGGKPGTPVIDGECDPGLGRGIRVRNHGTGVELLEVVEDCLVCDLA